MAKYTADQIADYFLAKVDEETGDNLSNLKLQKLVYYAQGFHLALSDGEPLFDDEIAAWAHGPVVPSLYHKYKARGADAIPAPDGFDISQFDQEARELLDEVWFVYGQFSALKLRKMAHDESPWKDAGPSGVVSRDTMREFFKTLIIDAHG